MSNPETGFWPKYNAWLSSLGFFDGSRRKKQNTGRTER